jgi:crossover junction endodeoxyribonuclease RuvC
VSAFLGIDPGLSGALALYDVASGALEVADMPVFRVKTKHVLDAHGLARIIDDWTSGSDVRVWLEFVASSPQMGVASSFKFGEGYGVVQGVLAANFLRVEKVTPAQWKRAMKVSGEKDECRAAACRLFPRRSALFARKKDDGRAEAALIALYGSRQHQPFTPEPLTPQEAEQ